MKLYRCYSNKLKEYLMLNGFRYEMVCLDIKTKKTMWLFEKTEQCEKLIELWNMDKK
jgi:hypothetical protein